MREVTIEKTRYDIMIPLSNRFPFTLSAIMLGFGILDFGFHP